MFRFTTLTVVAVAAFALTSSDAHAQLLGQSAAGWNRPSNPTHPTPPALAPEIKHKSVISITTFVQNQQTGRTSQVTWDFTTHVRNGNQWVELNWQPSYHSAVANLPHDWRATGRRSNGTRIVTGTW